MSDQIDELLQDIIAFGISDPVDSPEFHKKIKEAQLRRDAFFAHQARENRDFGYSSTNPIFTSSVQASNEYLQRLRTADGLCPTWDRIGSLVLDNLYGYQDIPIDEYQLLLDGEKYRKIYICPYGRDGEYAPKGMYLENKIQTGDKSKLKKEQQVQEADEERFENLGSLVNCRDNEQPKEEKIDAVLESTQVETLFTKDEMEKVETNPFPSLEVVECIKCHTQIRKEAKYCRNCGIKNPISNMSEDSFILRNPESEKDSQNNKEQKDHGLRNAIVFVLVILSLGAFAYWGIKSGFFTGDKLINSAIDQKVSVSKTVAPTVPIVQPTNTPQIDLAGNRSSYSTADLEMQAQIDDLVIGQIIEFGNYTQDNKSKKLDPLEWVIISKDTENSYVELITRCVIGASTYSNENNPRWSTSKVREWLNGVFLNTAFSPEEKKYIMITTIKDKGDNETSDRVFLLTSASIEKLLPVESDYRRAIATKYYKSIPGVTVKSDNTCTWMTRDPQIKILSSGEKEKTNGNVLLGIRPSIFLRIEKDTPIVKK